MQIASISRQRPRRRGKAAVEDALRGSVAPEGLLASLEPVRNLVAQNAARKDAAQRVGTMERDQALFAEKVAALAQTQGMSLGATPADSFAKLRAASDTARRAQTRAQDLDGQCAKTRAALDEARAALAEIARRVETYAAEFPTSAETSTLDALRVTANQAMQVIEKRVQLVKLERDILSELGAATLASARHSARGGNPCHPWHQAGPRPPPS